MKFHICIRTVKVKDTNNGKVKVIYDAQEVISGLKAPIVKDAEVINKQRFVFLNLVSLSISGGSFKDRAWTNI